MTRCVSALPRTRTGCEHARGLIGARIEPEARRILRQALEDKGAPRAGLGSRIAVRFARTGLDAPVPEVRDQQVRPPDFGR